MHDLNGLEVPPRLQAGTALFGAEGLRFSPHLYVPRAQLADAFDAIDGLRLTRWRPARVRRLTVARPGYRAWAATLPPYLP